MDIKEKIKLSPDSAGVYIFKDISSKIIYIGKASSIRKRLRGHFQKNITTKQRALIDNVADIDYIMTTNESTALILEAALIKRYSPKYNVLLKDDKSYPRLKLTVNEEYPRLFITRKLVNDGALYFGPYTNATLLREALKLTRGTFPLRTCLRIPKKECLDYHIAQCTGPCINNNKKSEYNDIVKQLELFLEGREKELIDGLIKKMEDFSKNKDFEKAANIRDRIRVLTSVFKPTGKSTYDALSFQMKPAIDPNQQITELKEILDLPKPPSIIEAFDISNISGKEAVGSMVSFKDGKAFKPGYMHFKIKTVDVIDDYSMMREIISRRYRKLSFEKGKVPDLIVIDGGKGHLSAAKKEIRKLRLINIPVISIAKNPDKIYLHEKKDPLILGKFSHALLLIQRIRDEAHRFAIDYHRLLRSKKLKASSLDNIKGIGKKRKMYLIKYFGSLNKIKFAKLEDLKGLDFISEKEAKAVYDYFRV